MDFQIVIVALILFAALVYAANLMRHKIKAFRPKEKSCGADCGCEKP